MDPNVQGEFAADLPQSPVRQEVARAGSNFFLHSFFDTISQASSDFSWHYRMSSRSADALQSALPEEQLQMWSQRYRCPPTAACLENLPRLRTMTPQMADKTLAYLMQAGELLAEKPRFPSKRKCQDIRWLTLLILVLASTASYAALVLIHHTEEAELHAIQELMRSGLLTASLAGCLGGMILSTSFILLSLASPKFMVRVFLLGSPVCLIAAGSICTTFNFTVAGSILLAIAIILFMLLFFGCLEFTTFTGSVIGQVLCDLVCCRTLLVHGLQVLFTFAWLGFCSLVVLAADVRFKDSAVQIAFAHVVVGLIYLWGAEVLGYMAQGVYCGLLLRSYLAEDTGAFRKSVRTAGAVAASSCYAATVGVPGWLCSTVRQAVARRKGKFRDGGQKPSAVPCPGRTFEYCGAWAAAVSAMRDVSHIEGANLAMCFLTCANAEVLLEELLLKSIGFFGALLCGLLGCAISIGTGLFLQIGGFIPFCGIIGFLSAFSSGRAAMGFILHGTVAFLLLWCEDPEPFRPLELHQEFELRIAAELSTEFGTLIRPAV